MRNKKIPALHSTTVYMVMFVALLATTALAAGLGGSWQGQVTQSDTETTYPVEMNLFGNSGNINYPSLGCGGNLAFIKKDGANFSYRERLTFGKDKCIDGGVIQLRRHALGDDATWEWRWDGGGVTVRGVIRGSGVEESK